MANDNLEVGTAAGRRVGIIVTHGVGDAEPGDVLRALTESVKQSGAVQVDGFTQMYRLGEHVTRDSGPAPLESVSLPKAVTQSKGERFPVVMQNATLGDGTRLTFAELYWADITRVASGRIGVILGLFRVIFEAHYVIDGMLDERRGPLTRTLRFLLLLLSSAMRGPIAGMTAAATAVCGVMLYWPRDYPGGESPLLLAAAILWVLFAANLVLLGYTSRRRDLTWSMTLLWIGIVSGVSASALTGLYAGDLIQAFPRFLDRAPYVNTAYSFAIIAWMIWGILYVVSVLLGLILSIGQRSAMTAVGILALQFTLWTALVGTAIVPLLNRAEEVKALNLVQGAVEREVVQLKANAAAAKSVTEKNKIAESQQLLGKLTSVPAIDEADWINRFRFAYGANGGILLTLIGILLAVWFIRIGLMRLPVDPAKTSPYLPRLMFSGFAIWVLCILVVNQVVLTIIAAKQFEDFIEGVYRLEAESCVAPGISCSIVRTFAFYQVGIYEFLRAWKYSIMGIAVMFGLLLPLMLGRALGNVLHIARDLIDHQYGSQEGRAFSFANPEMSREERWPRRARIENRFASIVANLNAQGQFDQMILVAHSQGSIIVYDYLRHAAPDFSDLRGLKPDVVTVGSPLQHLYQRYYHEYADVPERLKTLQPCLGRWINLYRPDDYVGTRIGPAKGGVVSNEALAPGGHITYWNDPRVADVILALATGDASRLPATTAPATGTGAAAA